MLYKFMDREGRLGCIGKERQDILMLLLLLALAPISSEPVQEDCVRQ